jgi:putative photosynthetic complex assembly protein
LAITTAPSPSHVPRIGLIAGAALVGLSLLGAVAGRITGPVSTHDESRPLASRELRFEDRADGGVTVRDASTGVAIASAEPGTNGFLRATLRGLATARKLRQVGAETPFRLTAWEDGRLTLEDPESHRRVELEAFGETNEAAFARLLHGEGHTL